MLPRYICWSYYYDPRCLREPPSNMAMFCVPNVMILAVIIESISWCHLVSRPSISGFLNPTFTLLHVDSVASSFRILVTFAIVLEVRGKSFFQYHEPIWQKFLVEPKDHNQSALDEFSILCCDCQFYLSAWVIWKKCWALLDILIYASTTQKRYMSLWVVPL